MGILKHIFSRLKRIFLAHKANSERINNLVIIRMQFEIILNFKAVFLPIIIVQ